MKKLFFLSVLTICTVSCFSQITINGDDLPQAGQNYIRVNSINPFIDEESTGANFIWNFTDLEISSTDSIEFVKVNQTPILYQFSFNNPLNPSYRATDAVPSEDLTLGPISMTNSYTYYKTKNNERNEVGRGLSFSAIPFPITYDDIKTLLPLPLNFQDSITDDFSYEFSVPNLLTIGQKGSIAATVDGWGTLYLPNDTFEVLRVRTETIAEDTIYLDTLGFGLSIPSTTVNYDWYAKQEGLPVLSITKNGLGIITGISFKYTPEKTTNINEISMASIKVYPNPAKQQITIDGISGLYQTEMLSIDGKQLISEQVTGPGIIEIKKLPKGIYLLRLSNENGTVTKRIIKE